MIANWMKKVALLLVVLTVAFGCKDRDAEKRIAYLENKLAEMEGKKKEVSPIQPVSETTAEAKPEGPLPVVQFTKTEHDFGTVKEGDEVTYRYTLKNTGEAPLIIQSAQPSCGCTVPDYTKSPIAPGETGFVSAKFDTKGKPGLQNKTITVTANTWPKQTVLRFKANVTPKPSGEDGPVR